MNASAESMRSRLQELAPGSIFTLAGVQGSQEAAKPILAASDTFGRHSSELLRGAWTVLRHDSMFHTIVARPVGATMTQIHFQGELIVNVLERSK